MARIEVWKLFALLLIPHLTEAIPMRAVELTPIVLSAPVSQIQWNFRGNWGPSESPHRDEAGSIRREDKDNLDVNDDDEIDQPALPSIVSYSITHPNGARSLQISVEPSKNDEVPKLTFSDSLLDSIKKFTPTEETITVAKRGSSRRPTPTTRRPGGPGRPGRPQQQERPRPGRPGSDDSGKEAGLITLIRRDENRQDDEFNTSEIAYPTTRRYPGNFLSGSSQLGNRESQMVIKPTVIVNFRGTVSNNDRDISVESRAQPQQQQQQPSYARIPQGVFNINQEVNIDRTFGSPDEDGGEEGPDSRNTKKVIPKKRLDVNVIGLPSDPKNKNQGNQQEYKIQASIKPHDPVVVNEVVNKKGKSLEVTVVDLPGDMSRKFYVINLGPLGGFLNSNA